MKVTLILRVVKIKRKYIAYLCRMPSSFFVLFVRYATKLLPIVSDSKKGKKNTIKGANILQPINVGIYY